MRSLGWALIQFDWYPDKRENAVATKVQSEDSYVNMEAETEVMLPQAKKHLRPPETGRGKEGSE